MKAIANYFLRHWPLNDMDRYANDPVALERAETMVRVFYCFLLFLSVGLFSPWDVSVAERALAAPLWPLFWLSFAAPAVGYGLIRCGFILTSCLAAFFPHVRAFRILSLIAILEFVSLYLSALQLDVDGYGLILTSFVFAFLPSRSSAAYARRFLAVFWTAIAINLLTYTMGGIGKLVGAYHQILIGESHFFSLKAASLHIADRLILTDATSALGPFAVAHPYLIYPYFLFTLYLLLFSFAVAFRPRAHGAWGMLLILFHIGNYLVINIGFVAHVFLWSILLVASPFSPRTQRFTDVLSSLPIIDLVWKRLQMLVRPRA